MSDAIRDVTIRVKIEQVSSGAALKAPELKQAESAYQSIAEAARQADIAQKASARSASEQAASLSAAEKAADRMVQNAVQRTRSGQAKDWITGGSDDFLAKNTQATKDAAAAAKQLSIENITGASNAIRAAVASGDLTGVVTGLGQALIFSAKGAAQQAEAIAHSAGAASKAAKSAGDMASGVSAAGTAATGISAALPYVAIGVGAVTIALELGITAWKMYSESSRTASDDIKDAVNQRLDAERQSWLVEQGILAERQKRLGSELVIQDKRAEKLAKYYDLQRQISAISNEASDKRLSIETDQGYQRRLLSERITLNDRGRLASSADALGFKMDWQNGINQGQFSNAIDRFTTQGFRSEGTDRVKDEKNRVEFLKEAESFRRQEILIAERGLQISQAQLQTDLQRRDASKARLQSIQDAITAEQGRLQTAQERFAQMDPGERMRLKSISEKAKSGGELSLQEAQVLSQSGLGSGFASQAFARIAEKQGFSQVANNLGEFDQMNQLRFQGKGESEKLKEIEARVRERQGEIDKAAETIANLAGSLEKISEALIKNSARLAELEKQYARNDTGQMKQYASKDLGWGSLLGGIPSAIASSAMKGL